MGNDIIQKTSQTMVTLSRDRVEVVQYIDNGCHDNVTAVEKAEALAPCEIRHYEFELPKAGATRLSASRRFAPGAPTPMSDIEAFERDLWAKAPLITTIAFDHAMRLLDYMADAKKTGLLRRRYINTAIGPVQVIPHCSPLGLQGVTAKLNDTHRLDVDITNPALLAEFSAVMCVRPGPSRLAVK